MVSFYSNRHSTTGVVERGKAIENIEKSITIWEQVNFNNPQRQEAENLLTMIKEKFPRHNPIVNIKKPNRNEPCSCGSGNKYKKCCGKIYNIYNIFKCL